jgi:2,3-bisphosphoglycerate-independent phosphoglycerate mutase
VAVEASYKSGTTDEFILPVCANFDGSDDGRLSDGDVALIFNFRADRVRQLCHLFTGYQPDGFAHSDIPDIHLVTMTNYDKELKTAEVAFPKVILSNIFGKVISRKGLKQLRIAETEKYPHVTYFFNGGIEEPFENEDRIMIPSPKVATYDLLPEMSSVAVTDEAVRCIKSDEYDVIILNFANCDMVGHTGILEAAVKAVEAVDVGVGRVLEAITDMGGAAIITADHGNAEQMYDPVTDGPHTAHTTNPVPFIFYDGTGRKKNIRLRRGGILADVAPTILKYLDIDQPSEMTGKSMLISGDVPAIKN